MHNFKAKVLGTGVYHPKKIVTNKDLEKLVETTDSWIVERTGIKERRICSTEGGEFPTDMAYHATQEALKRANIEVDAIDFIFFTTTTPDYKLPNSASILQTKLAMKRKCAGVDLAAACSGFVYATHLANALIQTGAIETALIIGSEMLSRETNWDDRNTCILFGDGCGAMLLGRDSEEGNSEILAGHLSTDGTGKDFFFQEIGGAIAPFNSENISDPKRFMQMQGKEMFKVAVRTLAENAEKVVHMAGLSLEEVDWVIPHQANIRIIEACAARLGVSMEKVVVNIDKYANTSAATIPIAFHEAIQDGRIKRGQTVLFDAFGAGLTSGAILLRY